MRTTKGYDYMDKYIGQSIKAERTKRGYSLVDFANKLNISKQRCSNYETGYRSLPLDMYFKICKELKINAEQLYKEAQDYMRKQIFK